MQVSWLGVIAIEVVNAPGIGSVPFVAEEVGSVETGSGSTVEFP
jgi:hypothetical protein